MRLRRPGIHGRGGGRNRPSASSSFNEKTPEHRIIQARRSLLRRTVGGRGAVAKTQYVSSTKYVRCAAGSWLGSCLSMGAKYQDKIQAHTSLPGARVDELWMILGRRSGKGRGASSLCCWYGFCHSFPTLPPGGRAEISCTAVTQFQAQRVMCDVILYWSDPELADNGLMSIAMWQPPP